MDPPEHGDQRPDPVIDEVRAVRRAICDQFDNDVRKLCEHLRQIEQQHQKRMVRPSKPRAKP